MTDYELVTAATTSVETVSTAPPPVAPPAAGPVTPPQPQPRRFAIGDPVLAKWARRQWYLAHVFDIKNDGRYCVYFMDGKTKTVSPDCVRPADDDAVSRDYYLNKEFFQDGMADLLPGTWKVRRIFHKKNIFLCVRMSGGEGHSDRVVKNLEAFDIAYVMRCIRDGEEFVRGHGPFR